MAEEIDLRFLGEQIKRLQGDVRQLKTDMAQMRADTVKVEADMTRIENKIEAFRESVDDRFDQNVELLKSSFRTLADEIKSLKKT